MNREDLLQEVVRSIDIKAFDVVGLVESMSQMAFQARNLGRAAKIYDEMLQDPDCAIILCLAGSLFSAGLKNIDSVRDFRELTQCKLASKYTGLVMIGGGVPKNFAQDTVVAAEMLGFDVTMHKYTIQITVADERDGALSGFYFARSTFLGKSQQKRRTNGIFRSYGGVAVDCWLCLWQGEMARSRPASFGTIIPVH